MQSGMHFGRINRCDLAASAHLACLDAVTANRRTSLALSHPASIVAHRQTQFAARHFKFSALDLCHTVISFQSL